MDLNTTILPILSTSTIPQTNDLFNKFNGHKFPFDYLILQIILFLFTIASIFMNSIVVGATIYSK